ncbi:MAG TPA: tetratricopeptide repeat protein [Polyangiaceae bacterium]|nr:tetratricopeptide repeat protein [Polyangiaceae bacterium]
MGSPRDGVEPTVLLVGAGERFTPAFQAALSRHEVQVETTELHAVVDAVIVTAPDLVLLMGEAAKDGGASVLQKLASLSQNFTVPVVVLSDDAELDAKLSAFRHGATAVLPRSASVDATAERVAKMARELPEQGTEAQGAVGDATLDEFIGVLSKELRAGLVSSLGSGGDLQDLKLTLGRGRPLTEFLDTFVRRVRRHVVRAEPLRYELGGAQPGDALGTPRASLPVAAPAIDGLRVVVADEETPRADAVAQELRKRGVTVVVTDLEPSPTRFQTLRQADPTVFVIGEDHANGAGYDLLRRLRRDSRLRWASLLVVRWDEIWSEERGAPALGRLESTLAGLVEPERALFARAEARTAFDTRLETTGPARCLRVLERSARPLRVRIENPRVELTLDLSDGLVVGAEGRTLELEPRTLSGVNALSALLVLGSGRVRVEPVDQPATANVMTPVEAALTMADAETPPISPSIPAAGTVSLHPPGPAELAPASAPRSSPHAAPVGSIRPAPVVAVAAALPPRPAVRPSAPLAPSRPVAPPARSPLAPVPQHATPALAATVAASVPTLSGMPVASVPPGPAASVPPHERNPPAMTVSAPLEPTPSPEPGARALPPKPWQARLRAFSAWFARQDAKLHRKRIAPATAAVLVGLGALQGLLIVMLYAGARWLSRPRVAVERTPAARELASERALPSPPPEEPPAPKTSAAPVAPTVTPAVSSAGDGSDRDVPDCKTLLGADPPHQGFYPGAALQQMRFGRAAIVHGDLKAAQTSLCRAATWNPESSEIALELALVLLLERDGAEAATWARRAVELDPKNSAAEDALGDALARLGSETEARGAFLAAAHIDAGDRAGVRALVTRAMKQGDQALRHGDFLTAERGFRRALVLEPKSSSAASGLSYALLELGDGAAGVVWAKHAVELAPRSSGARLVLGDALAKSGDKTAAAGEWREAVLLDPANREAQKRLRAAGLPPT